MCRRRHSMTDKMPPNNLHVRQDAGDDPPLVPRSCYCHCFLYCCSCGINYIDKDQAGAIILLPGKVFQNMRKFRFAKPAQFISLSPCPLRWQASTPIRQVPFSTGEKRRGATAPRFHCLLLKLSHFHQLSFAGHGTAEGSQQRESSRYPSPRRHGMPAGSTRLAHARPHAGSAPVRPLAV